MPATTPIEPPHPMDAGKRAHSLERLDLGGRRGRLALHASAHHGRALITLTTSVVAYVGFAVAIYLALRTSYLLAVALSLPAAICLIRTFIVFHDCSHGSFLRWKRGNVWLGRTLGLLLCSPFARWKHDHAVHHATSGDLERRGTGDVRTLTIREYDALTRAARIAYRLQRSPIVMFGLGPIIAMIIGPRFVPRDARPRIRRSVIYTDVGLAIAVSLLCWLIGWRSLLLVYGLPALIAGSIGIWLFYVQHQFEEAYWESGDNWNYTDAALKGSSFLDFPRLLHFCTGNIGYHHVHHLSARVPCYNLRRAHEENPEFQAVPRLAIADGLRAVRLKLWDEDRRRLVTFRQAREAPAT